MTATLIIDDARRAVVMAKTIRAIDGIAKSARYDRSRVASGGTRADASPDAEVVATLSRAEACGAPPSLGPRGRRPAVTRPQRRETPFAPRPASSPGPGARR